MKYWDFVLGMRHSFCIVSETHFKMLHFMRIFTISIRFSNWNSFANHKSKKIRKKIAQYPIHIYIPLLATVGTIFKEKLSLTSTVKVKVQFWNSGRVKKGTSDLHSC